MKKYVILILFVLNGLFSISQVPDWDWAKKFGGSSDEFPTSSCMDSQGNIYIAGNFHSPTLTFGSTTLTKVGSTNLFLAKMDAVGNVLWAKRAGATGVSNLNCTGLCMDISGNVHITGSYSGSGTLIFGGFSLNNSFPFYSDFFVAKYDSLGNVLGARSYGGDGDDQSKSIAADNIGNIFITGNFRSWNIIFGNDTLTNQSGVGKIFTIKFDSLQNIVWTKIGETWNLSNSGISVSPDAFGNCLVTGNFSSSHIVFGTDTLLKPVSGGIFIVKYGLSGSVLWAKVFPATDVVGISTDNFGNSYITGGMRNASTIIDNDTLINADSTGNSYDFYITKYSPSGSIIWAKSYGGGLDDRSQDIFTDANGYIYLTGTFQDTVLVLDTVILTNAGIFNAYVAKFDSSGNLLFARSPSGNLNSGHNIISNANGQMYLTGVFQGPDIILGSDTLMNNNSGNYDFFVASLNSPYSVWPGDADHNLVANNNDLLPIGLYYGLTGPARASIGNIWQAELCASWTLNQINGADLKHIDCNGDGIIDSNDTLAINLNFNATHTITAINNYNNERLTAPDIYFITSGNSYNAGDWVDLEVWLGNSTLSVNNLYGIAFNINYDASLVQPGTESITYPVSWLGSPGTDAIKMMKIDAIANTAYGVITRTDHSNSSGFGKIADFKFQVKTTISSTQVFHFSISDYIADNAAGILQVFNTINDSISLNADGLGLAEVNSNSGITIFPNPFTAQTTIAFNEKQTNIIIKIVDVLGKEVRSIDFSGKQLIIEKGEMENGIYFVQIIDSKGKVVNRKIIIK